MRHTIAAVWTVLFNRMAGLRRYIRNRNGAYLGLPILGWMWILALLIAVGSYVFLAVSLVGQMVLISAAAINVATYTVAAKPQRIVITGSGRRRDGEHL